MLKFVLALCFSISMIAHAAPKDSSVSVKKSSTIDKWWSQYKQKDHKVMPVVGLTAFQLNGLGAKTSNGNGYTVGAVVEDKLNTGLKLQYGIQYYQANSEHSVYIPGAPTRANIDIERKYLGVPVFAVKELNPGNRTAYVKGGGVLSYLMDSKAISRDVLFEKSLNTAFKREDLMATAGVGYRIQRPNVSTLNLEVAYNRGLIDVVRGSGPSNRGTSEGWMFTAGVLF